ncbi:hypothetical protein TcasGA2_TC006016 [Tribolium castaneum]|uniref:Uncharacterized protein n=1 Tax=Tribolium castaneum TaxID=7070 RepID=D6WUJ7_TRICA|nr:hypothetical protein TcasGA2_TC006016 [Tribolium castaneum]
MQTWSESQVSRPFSPFLKSLFFRLNDQKTDRFKAGIRKTLKFKLLLTAHYSSTPSSESFAARPPLISIPLNQKAIKPGRF